MFLILVVFISMISLEFVVVNKQTNIAAGFLEVCIRDIEASYFDEEVIDYYLKKAKDNGYYLTFEDKSRVYIEESVPEYLLSLKYNVVMPVFGISLENEMKGYAN